MVEAMESFLELKSAWIVFLTIGLEHLFKKGNCEDFKNFWKWVFFLDFKSFTMFNIWLSNNIECLIDFTCFLAMKRGFSQVRFKLCFEVIS